MKEFVEDQFSLWDKRVKWFHTKRDIPSSKRFIKAVRVEWVREQGFEDFPLHEGQEVLYYVHIRQLTKETLTEEAEGRRSSLRK